MHRQTTGKIVMIKPIGFYSNKETAVNNFYQHTETEDRATIQRKAKEEFENLAEKLLKAGIEVNIIEDTAEPSTPDSIFPNNWFSSHEKGKFFFYPMYAKNRRAELVKFKEKLLKIAESSNISITDYSSKAEKGIFLEGTGSIIFDRKNMKAYCSLSPRADKNLFLEFCRETGYHPVIFSSYQDGHLIYHTNVMMGLGENKAVICLECIKDEKERKNVINELTESKKDIVEISLEQVKKFLGNVIELKGKNGKQYTVMSETAYKSLTSEQEKKISKDTEIIYSDVKTIEYYGGGSVRCMIGEIF